jgi:hypothetical protein
MDGEAFTQIRVINRNPFPLVDRYDNVAYVFEPEVAKTVPADVAAHIFGYTPDATEEDLFRHVTRRFGWNTPAMMADEHARLYFDNLDIKPVQFRMVQVEETEARPPYPGTEGTEPIGSRKATHRGVAIHQGRRKPGRPRKDEQTTTDEPEAPAAEVAA